MIISLTILKPTKVILTFVKNIIIFLANYDDIGLNESLAVGDYSRIEVPTNPKANFTIKLKEGYNAISLIKEYCDKIGAKIDWRAEPSKNRVG